MREGFFRKGMVLAIVCCFIGAGVFPTISGDIETASKDPSKKTSSMQTIMARVLMTGQLLIL